MIKLLILDCDGVLTTGELPYSACGNEVKVFHVHDGWAIRLWQAMGGKVAVISGRGSESLAARARDLGIESVWQKVADKMPVYEKVCRLEGWTDAEAAFVGDDVIDLGPMRRCRYPIAVANAAPVVKRAARYVTRRRGGRGAVAEAVERLLRHNGTWTKARERWSV